MKPVKIGAKRPHMTKSSMIVDHPLWDRVKAKKGTIDPMSGLEIKEFFLPNDKYYNLLEELSGVKKK